MTPLALSGRPAEALRAFQEGLLTPPSPRDELLYGMMRYHLGWVGRDFQPIEAAGGKGVRARLALLVCRAEGAGWEPALPAAAAVELLHSFSLVHDDIEDGSPTRHGRETLWKVWGVPLALNAGDALFTLARQALLQLDSVAALAMLEEASLDLCRGQHLDLAHGGRVGLDLNEYYEVIGGKTAALIRLSCGLGALAAGALPKRQAGYARFGWELGLAYQISDDFLGVWGDAGVTGKPVGEDLLQRKLTFPVAFAWQALDDTGRSQTAELWRREPWNTEAVEAARRLLEASGAREACRERAETHARAAREALPPPLPGGDAQAYKELEGLAGLIGGRET